MAIDYDKAIAKLDRPPSGPNWVRFVHDNKSTTTKRLLSFTKGLPPFTYAPGYTAIRDAIELGIGLEQAVRLVRGRGAPAGRQQNEELVRAFFTYEEARQYRSANPIQFEREWFRVSRDVSVPVSPLSIIRENGQFVPIFVCGWSELALTLQQRRLLMTIYEDAFLSLTDYQASPSEFLFFPKVVEEEGKIRKPEIWSRGDYELLNNAELDDAVRIFLEAREEARAILLSEKALIEANRKADSKDEDRSDDLFDERKP